jgi:shikimate dehydrogenase
MSEARKAAVLGHPISHSLSPVLHRAAYSALGLDWEYDARDVKAGGLGAFLESLDASWVGLSLTMPLKIEAVEHLDFLEPLAKALGAANTILLQPEGSGGHRVGANTDVQGIVSALSEAGVESVGSAVILGAGATATAAMAALATLGCSNPIVAVRDRSRTGGLVRAAARLGVSPRFVDLADGVSPLAHADAVVSTIPAEAGATVARALEGATMAGTLLDAVYDPRPTPLTGAWLAAGGASIDGTRMLLHQAAEQVRLFTGRAAPLVAMDRALVSHLSH